MMSSTPLDPAQIAKLLKEEAQQPTTGTRTRGPKVDPTLDRTYNGWFKLNHHLCTRDCPHRTDPNNPTAKLVSKEDGAIGNACWNLNCEDHTRDKETDRGANIVVNVKDQYICRYCYMAEYLL